MKQLRPAVLFREIVKDSKDKSSIEQINESLEKMSLDQGTKGITLELCLGIVEQDDKSLKENALEGIEEECGFKASKPIDFQTFLEDSTGIGGQKMSLFYAEVSDGDRKSSGGRS